MDRLGVQVPGRALREACGPSLFRLQPRIGEKLERTAIMAIARISLVVHYDETSVDDLDELEMALERES